MAVGDITVPNRVAGSGGLPELTRVGNPEGSFGDGQGFNGFTDSDYLTGLQLDRDFAANSDPRLIVIKWTHKAGAPASGDFQYLIGRSNTADGGLDVRLRNNSYDTLQVRPYTSSPSSAGPQAITHTRGNTYWTFLQFRDPTYGGVGNDWDWWRYLESTTPDDGAGGTGLTADVEWDAPGDHTVGSQGGAASTGADDVIIYEIRMYDADPAAAAGDESFFEDIVNGTDDHEADMVLWYTGISTETASGLAEKPDQFLIWHDPLLEGGEDTIASVDSEKGPRLGTVTPGSANEGALLPQVLGTPDSDARDIRFAINRGGGLGSAEWVWRPAWTEATSQWRGSNDPTYLHCPHTPFNAVQSPEIVYSSLYHRVIVYGEIGGSVKPYTLDVDEVQPTGNGDWTGQSLFADGSVADSLDHALAACELQDGSILIAVKRPNYATTPTAPVSLDEGGDIDIYRSTDGGETHSLVSDEIIRRFVDDLYIVEPRVQLHMASSGDFVRLLFHDAQNDATVVLVSTDGGLTWGEVETIGTGTMPLDSNHDDDQLHYSLVGLGDRAGTFLLCFYDGTSLQWYTGSRTQGFTTLGVGTALSDVRSIGLVRTPAWIYTFVWIVDPAGNTVNSTWMRRAPTDDPLDTSKWQTGSTRYDMVEAVRYYPGVLKMDWCGRFVGAIGRLLDPESNPTAIAFVGGTDEVFFKMGDWSVESLASNGQFDISGRLTYLEWWAAFGIPAGGGAQSATGTEWTETQAGTGSVTWTANRLDIDSGALNDQEYFSWKNVGSVVNWADGATPNTRRYAAEWVLSADSGDGADTEDTIAVQFIEPNAGPGSSDVYNIKVRHGPQVTALYDVQASAVLATLGHAAIDGGESGPYGRFRLYVNPGTHIAGGTYPGLRLAFAREDDPLTWSSTALVTPTPSATGETEHDIRFGCINQDSGGTKGSHWKEARIFAFVRPNHAASEPSGADLPGMPATNVVWYLERGLSVAWGGGMGIRTDRFDYYMAHDYPAEHALLDSPRLQWRSLAGATTGTAIIFDAGKGSDSQQRFHHDSVALFGLESRRVTIDYDNTTDFSSPIGTKSYDGQFLTGLAISAIQGNVAQVAHGSFTLRAGYLAGHYLRLTAAGVTAAVENVYLVEQHWGVNGTHYVRLSTDGSWGVGSISAGDTAAAFASKGVVIDSSISNAQRYMRLRFGETGDKAWKDEWTLGKIVAGISYGFPVPLDWSHSRETTPNLQQFRTRGSVSWAYEESVPSDQLVLTVRGDASDEIGLISDMLETMQGFGRRPLALALNEAATHEVELLRYAGSVRRSNPAWKLDSNDLRTYYPMGADLQMQFDEVP